jgi:dolichol-phosphate mannosyltransferase
MGARLMAEEPDLSILVPAYMEEQNLRLLLPALRQALDGLTDRGEIVVVDTVKPMDGTEEVCREHGARYVPRRGGDHYGDAVRTAVAEARGRWCIFMDADGSHSPAFVRELYARREEGDVVVASRYVAGGATDNPRVLIWMSRIVNWTYALILRLPCRDISNSFKLYRTAMLKALTLDCNSFDIIEEILFKLSLHHRPLKIVEIPFTFKERMFGRTKRSLFLFALAYAVTLIKLRWKGRHG